MGIPVSLTHCGFEFAFTGAIKIEAVLLSFGAFGYTIGACVRLKIELSIVSGNEGSDSLLC